MINSSLPYNLKTHRTTPPVHRGAYNPIPMSNVTNTSPRPPLLLYDLDLTIVSAKHLKNVNWKNGDLKPYVILWVDPDRRQATKPDDSGSTRPVWNERFVLPLTLHPRESILTVEVFHCKPSDTPKPLVGTLRFELRKLIIGSDEFTGRVKTFDLNRPSGRPHGKIRIKLAVIERLMENYQTSPTAGYYYSAAPPPPMHPHGYRSYSVPQQYPYGPYSDLRSRYYVPAPPPRPVFEQESGYSGTGPSAPVDYTPYDYHKRSGVKSEMGSGLAVGTVAGGVGGMALEDGIKYEEEKIENREENDSASTSRGDRYGAYRNDY